MTQQLPLEQLASTVQVDGQVDAAPLQTYGAQLGLPADPAGTLVQLPRLPATLQALQAPAHELLQQ
jgi:hypothetical protein